MYQSRAPQSRAPKPNPRKNLSRVAVGLTIAIVAIAGVQASHLWLETRAPSARPQADQPVSADQTVQLVDLMAAPPVWPDLAPEAAGSDGATFVADGVIPDGIIGADVVPGPVQPTELRDMAAFAEGAMPDGVTVTDGQYPGIANLDPELLAALRQAATDAADEGITFFVNSGWRSAEYQNQLLRDAIVQYGSPEEAARWVATADQSKHVSGDAIDLGGQDTAAWLMENGATYGLCQIYLNEPWHFELRPEAATSDCPGMYTDPTQDPRMQ